MLRPKITQKDYTTLGNAYQLHLPLNVEFQIPKDDPVRLLRYIVEGMDLSELYRSYSHHEKNQASPRQLLEILIYANMNCIRSSRKIEQACKRDSNFMFLLQGKVRFHWNSEVSISSYQRFFKRNGREFRTNHFGKRD